MLVQNKTHHKFTRESVNLALLEIAKRRGRPDHYLPIVCRDVVEAIKTDKEHHLKNEVLEVLSGKESRHEIVDRDVIIRKVHKIDGEYAEKLKIAKDWCAQGYGRYARIGQLIGMKALNLKRKLVLSTLPSHEEIELIYNTVKVFIDEENGDTHSSIGTQENEAFLSKCLEFFIDELVVLTRFNVKHGLNLDAQGVFVSFTLTRIDDYPVHTRNRLARALTNKGIWKSLQKVHRNATRWVLLDQVFVESIYLKAIERMGMEFNNPSHISRLKSYLRLETYKHFHISEQYILNTAKDAPKIAS